MPFDDACNIMYINGDYRGDNPLGKLMHDFSASNPDEMYYEELARRVRFHKQNEKQKAFMEFVFGRKPSDKFTERLAQLTEEAKHNTEWKKQYMNWERQRTYDYENGKEAGAQQKAVEAAINLLKMKVGTPEQISQAQSLPLEQVLELQKQVQ